MLFLELKNELYEAIYNNNVEFVGKLISSTEKISLINTIFEERSQTALHIAATNGHIDICKILCNEGAQLEIIDDGGYTPLLAAAAEGHTEIVKKLIEFGASIEVILKTGENALSLAVANGHTETATALLESGIAREVVNRITGNTILHLAAIGGYIDIIVKLLEIDQNVDLANLEGETPLHLAVIGGHTEVIAKLLEVGANINLATQNGKTALHLAIIYDHTKIFNQLLDNNADINSITYKCETALHLAAASGNTTILNKLLESDVKEQFNNIVGANALYIAAINGHYDAVLILINHNLTLEYNPDLIIDNDLEIEDKIFSEICKLLYQLVVEDIERLNIDRLLKAIINISEDTDIIFSKQYKNNYLNILRILQKGLLIDNIFQGEKGEVSKYALHVSDIADVLPRLEYLCRRQGIPNCLLNTVALPTNIRPQVVKLLTEIRVNKKDIVEAIELPLAQILNSLYPNQFPSRLPYSALINLKDIGKDATTRQINLNTYKEKICYQPYYFFFYMIDGNNHKDVTEMFIKYPLEFKLIFNSLDKLAFDANECRKLQSLKAKLDSPHIKRKLIDNLYSIISDVLFDINTQAQIIDRIEHTINSQGEVIIKQQEVIQDLHSYGYKAQMSTENIMIKPAKANKFVISKKTTESFTASEEARIKNTKNKCIGYSYD